MAEPGFQVVFDGQLVEGADPAQVKANIAKLFKLEVDKVGPLFSGRRTVVKRGLDEASAQKYCIAFERAGAVATIIDPSALVPSAASPAPAAPAEESQPAKAVDAEDEGPSRLDVAEASRAPPPLIARGLPSAPDGMTMADAGSMLVEEPSTIKAPDIDTSHLTLSEPGVNLVEHKKVVAPEFDLSALELSPLGNDP